MDYRIGQFIDDEFLLLKASVEETKRGKKYIKFNIRDSEGWEIEQCKKWDCGQLPDFPVIRIVGKVSEYQGCKHIIADRWEKGQKLPNQFSPSAPWSIDGESILDRFIFCLDYIGDEELRSWIQDFVFYWEDHSFPTLIEGEGVDIQNATAAMTIHHAYRYGWLEHVLEVVEICHRLRGMYQNISVINSTEGDLLIAGAFIHDIGKLFQFEFVDGMYRYTKLCKAYGWHGNAEQIIGSNMLSVYCAEKGFLPPGDMTTFLALTNMIISHHGNQFSIGNSTYIISRILHFADHISSDINRMKKNLFDKDEVERDKIRESYMRIE